MLSRMVVNGGVGDDRAQNRLHGGQTFKGVPVKAQLGVLISPSLRWIIPVYHARTLCPGVAQFCTGMSRLATHVHDGAMVPSQSLLTVDNPGQLEHGLSIEH